MPPERRHRHNTNDTPVTCTTTVPTEESVESIAQSMLSLQRQIAQAREDRARIDGQLQQLWAGLAEHRITTLPQLSQKLVSLQSKLDTLTAKLRSKYNELRDHYSW